MMSLSGETEVLTPMIKLDIKAPNRFYCPGQLGGENCKDPTPNMQTLSG